MRRLILTILTVGVFGVGAELLPSVSIASAQKPEIPGQAAQAWVSENYLKLLDSVLPPGPGTCEGRCKWRVTARVMPPFEQPEHWFTLTRTYDGEVELCTIRPTNGSIYQQFVSGRAKSPKADTEQLVKALHLEKRCVNERERAVLRALSEQFQTLRTSLVLPDDTSADDTKYEVWTLSQWGNNLYVAVASAGQNAPGQGSPVAAWVEEVRHVTENEK